MSTATTVHTVARRVMEEIRDALREAATHVDLAVVYPAATPWDACACGMLAVAVQRQWITTDFPAPAQADSLPCGGGMIAADVIVQVLRCAPQPEGTDLMPSPRALEETAQLILSDGWIVLSTLQCLLPALAEQDVIVEHLIQPQIFAPPSGGCVGSACVFTIGVEQTG